jgi:hypothetical protein
MRSLIAWMLLCGFCAADDTFGLGEPEPVQCVSVGDTFGLAESITAKSSGKDASKATDGIFLKREVIPLGKISFDEKELKSVIPAKEKSGLLPVIRRSQNNWTDPDVGAWTPSKLREHLMGDFQSPVHRGSVPLSQLQGRSLSDLLAIHANLHEGWNWDGTSKRQLQVATIKERLTVPATVRSFRSVETCPSGNCPTGGQQSFRLFRRR